MSIETLYHHLIKEDFSGFVEFYEKSTLGTYCAYHPQLLTTAYRQIEFSDTRYQDFIYYLLDIEPNTQLMSLLVAQKVDVWPMISTIKDSEMMAEILDVKSPLFQASTQYDNLDFLDTLSHRIGFTPVLKQVLKSSSHKLNHHFIAQADMSHNDIVARYCIDNIKYDFDKKFDFSHVVEFFNKQGMDSYDIFHSYREKSLQESSTFIKVFQMVRNMRGNDVEWINYITGNSKWTQSIYSYQKPTELKGNFWNPEEIINTDNINTILLQLSLTRLPEKPKDKITRKI